MLSLTDINLRRPRPDDLDALRAIRNDITAQAILLGHPEARNGADDTEAWIERRSSDAAGSFLVIDCGGECVGFAQITGRHGIDQYAHFGIALRADARGMGAGGRAMRLLLAEAASAGLRKLLCEVRADNANAIALYRRLGFRDVGTLTAHYNDGERFWDVVLMELMLAEADRA